MRENVILKHNTEKRLISDLNEINEKRQQQERNFQNKLIFQGKKDIYLYEGQNGFVLTFKEFGFSGLKKGEIVIFVINFLDQVVETPIIKVGIDRDEFSCLIACDNDGIVTKIVTQRINVSVMNSQRKEIGRGSIDITPLVDADKIVTSIEIYTPQNKLIAASGLNVSIVEPLY